jgi:hypothetical protein
MEQVCTTRADRQAQHARQGGIRDGLSPSGRPSGRGHDCAIRMSLSFGPGGVRLGLIACGAARVLGLGSHSAMIMAGRANTTGTHHPPATDMQRGCLARRRLLDAQHIQRWSPRRLLWGPATITYAYLSLTRFVADRMMRSGSSAPFTAPCKALCSCVMAPHSRPQPARVLCGSIRVAPA